MYKIMWTNVRQMKIWESRKQKLLRNSKFDECNSNQNEKAYS